MGENKVKVSVIVPVYNIEKYLPRMIESVISQSFDEWEMILTDDGSKDSSGKICDDFANKDCRIKVIHQQNQGAHMARNNALKVAKGEYICFFDGDDRIEENTLQDLYNEAKINNLDLLVSGFYIETMYKKDEYLTLNYIPEENIFTKKEEFRKQSPKFFDINMFYPPWNKIYKKKYLDENNIIFPQTYRDDYPFVMHVIRDIERIGFTKKQYYHFYRQREESETQKYVKNLYEKREEEQKLMIDTFTYWGLMDDKNVKDMLARRYIDRLIECMVNLQNKLSGLSNNEVKAEIKKYLENPYVDKCLQEALPKKLYSKIMYSIIKTKNISLIMFLTNFIENVRTKNIKLFSILKTNR